MGEKTKGEGWLDVGNHLGWFVRYEHTDTWLDFKAYEVIAESLAPEPGLKYFQRRGAKASDAHTTSVDEADVELAGYVKWDGCCEITIGQPHFCGSEDLVTWSLVLQQLHSLCLLLPSVDRDCAGYTDDERAGLKESNADE